MTCHALGVANRRRKKFELQTVTRVVVLYTVSLCLSVVVSQTNIDLIMEVFCNAEICCSICYQRVNTDVANMQQWAKT